MAPHASRATDTAEAAGWRLDPTPQVYDCRELSRLVPAVAWWLRTCSLAASKHAPHTAPRNLSWAAPPSRARLLELLANRTVYVLGDSHALDLWCALSCWLLRADPTAATVELEHQQEGHGRDKVERVLVTRLPGVGYEGRWRLPTCAYGKGGRCGTGTHCGTIGRPACAVGCGLSLLPEPLPGSRSVVALLSPCPSHQGGSELSTQLRIGGLLREATLEQFGTWADPFAPLCGGGLGQGACGASFENKTVAAYRPRAAAAAAALRKLRDHSNRSSLGVFLGAPVSHFPEAGNGGDAAAVPPALRLGSEYAAQLDGRGSHDRYLASALLWLHTRLHAAPNASAALAYLASLGIRRPAPIAIWGSAGASNFFEPSVGLGASRAEQAYGCVAQPDVAACMLPHTLALAGQDGGAVGAMRPEACAPIARGTRAAEGGARGGKGAGLDDGAVESSWRQREERRAARAAGVPYLDSSVPRRARWDLHAGIQGGRGSSVWKVSNRYDCTHSSLSPGAFDAELAGLINALEAERQGLLDGSAGGS